jgi:hypothetical protein
MIGDRISNGSEEVPSPKPFPFFVPRRKKRGKGSVGGRPDRRSSRKQISGFIPCCQNRSTHTYGPGSPGYLKQARFKIHHVKS